MELYKKLSWCFPILVKFAKQVITPSFCVQCAYYLNDPDQFFCRACLDLINPLATIMLKITDAYNVIVYAVTDYKEPLRSLILAKHNRQRLAAHYLGQLLWEKTDLHYADFDYIVPVPLHWSRYAWRWFNQSDTIAQFISEKSGKPVIHLVERVMKTSSQAGLTRFERIKNVQEAFVLSGDAQRYVGAKLLFIDDVMTTGTTIQAVIKKTLILKPKAIIIAVPCRVV